ncbi:hypothetical protein [Mycolicibacterium fortuitum]|uniref:hypothetical protein n=1 Tax=Mycolicibacterium fortuitum TaxID=1766 RepID=UPI001CDC11EF|nr:hypothetical protein [Mycolicibacterium fortuitum]UBV14974.1 hypothetical protein H8Z57_30550 [Mycolicibacterium fortuitum]
MSADKELTATDHLLKRWSWAVLVIGALASGAVNAVYALRVGDNSVVHAIVPLLVLGLGLFAELVFLSSHPRPVRWLGGIGSVAGFALALVMSYHAIREVLGQELASVRGPLTDTAAALPDVLMLIAATVLLSHRWRATRSAPTDAQRSPSRLQRLRDKALDRVEASLDKPANPHVNAVPEAVNAPLNAAEAVNHNGHSTVTPPDWARSVTAVPTEPVTEAVNASATDRHVHEARELLDRTGKRVAIETLAAALAALDAETPIKTISRELGMGERTLREVRDARRPLAYRLAPSPS